MKCLTEKDLMNAVQMDGELTFDGKKLELRVAAERKKDKGDRDHKKKHHKKEYENWEEERMKGKIWFMWHLNL